ncbi:fhkA [Symbiodinium natans]|uniref:FhkA protein n=1 Tax=Symbiodinium natans TaxID=878477 RepID=A0A812IFX9_9DINO|nr:fhkA [Symbiodinium natans]
MWECVPYCALVRIIPGRCTSPKNVCNSLASSPWVHMGSESESLDGLPPVRGRRASRRALLDSDDSPEVNTQTASALLRAVEKPGAADPPNLGTSNGLAEVDVLGRGSARPRCIGDLRLSSQDEVVSELRAQRLDIDQLQRCSAVLREEMEQQKQVIKLLMLSNDQLLTVVEEQRALIEQLRCQTPPSTIRTEPTSIGSMTCERSQEPPTKQRGNGAGGKQKVDAQRLTDLGRAPSGSGYASSDDEAYQICVFSNAQRLSILQKRRIANFHPGAPRFVSLRRQVFICSLIHHELQMEAEGEACAKRRRCALLTIQYAMAGAVRGVTGTLALGVVDNLGCLETRLRFLKAPKASNIDDPLTLAPAPRAFQVTNDDHLGFSCVHDMLTHLGCSSATSAGASVGAAESRPARPYDKADGRRETCLDPRCTNLNYFHDFASLDHLISAGRFTKRKDLSECCRGQGKVELHSMSSEDYEELVVVKKLPAARVNINRGKPGSELAMHQRAIARDSEDPLAEIGVFSFLRRCEKTPQYLLEMLSAFQVSDEIWLVLENADGGDLFGVVSSQRPSTGQIMLWAWQLLQAVKFLHMQCISHRDISLENVLLSGGDVRLMDFGQAVQTHLETGELCRYFVPAGKPYYRPPEAYIPAQGSLAVMAPVGSRAGQVALALTPAQDFLCHVRLLEAAEPGQLCAAEPWGYTAPPIDIFACAVSITIMFLAGPPWRQARPTDKYFQWVQSNGLAALATSWKKAVPSSAAELLSQMMQTDPDRRPAVEACLGHSWFAPLCSAPVALREGASSPAGSPGSPRLAGDCYREQEWVCRSLPGLPAEVAYASPDGPEFDVPGDPYRDFQPWSTDLHLPLEPGDAEISGLLCDVPPAPPPLPLVREDRTDITKMEADVDRDLQASFAQAGPDRQCRDGHSRDALADAPIRPSLPTCGRSRSEASPCGCLAGSPAQALRTLRKTSSGGREDKVWDTT